MIYSGDKLLTTLIGLLVTASMLTGCLDSEDVSDEGDDELEDWKRENRESFQKEEVHTYGYEATTAINESYVEIKGKPFPTWPKQPHKKSDDKCNNNNGYPNKVANILKHHNPQNLPLDLK